ncbi:nickel ABC transporter permease subunit NikC [Camelimonas abortus]|uniref:Nickel ABC transporter permease subunit NikC n=1 Tax=Camelimonas abortus TaxID=1017184 RepID=A0ABV7LFR9_9HYPH
MRLWRGAAWSGRLGFVLTGLITLVVAFGPALMPWDPDAIALAERLQPPGAAHWLGTDHLGRDVLSRLIAGARVSLGAVAAAMALILAAGVTLGGAAALLGGRADQAIMRLADVFLTFPTLVLALFLIGVLGAGMTNVIIAIALSHWAWYARTARGAVIALRSRDHVLAARMAGASRVRIFLRHMAPAALSQLLTLATLDIGHIMLHVSSLSFLGLGVAPPAAEWGVMIADARPYVWTSPLLVLWPGLALCLSVMALNLTGDALRDHLDPRLRMEHGH